ncbi:MAG: hypothetical protein HOG80_11600 [Candidatus Marinimicrobia bacterium]|nr:hypothetical protein [Candidatus Neomarinimicrobiota bacterium]MBT5271247.1 hypothetical protein [Candidatus Neomarinimicrobiota bacterium]MBT6012014.1 hypothetical protein [Candidatus Neomarinimicrobiota bacterium]
MSKKRERVCRNALLKMFHAMERECIHQAIYDASNESEVDESEVPGFVYASYTFFAKDIEVMTDEYCQDISDYLTCKVRQFDAALPVLGSITFGALSDDYDHYTLDLSTMTII